MGDLVLKGATSGQITLTPTAIAGTNTLTLPAKTGNIITSADSGTVTQTMLASNVAGNGPAFIAYPSANTTLTTGYANYLVAVNTIVRNDGSCFNNTGSTVTLNGLSVPAYAFCPNVAGYYFVAYSAILTDASSNMLSQVYKNGSVYAVAAAGGIVSGSAYNTSSAGSTVVYLNGTGDYIQMYYTASSSSKTAQGGNAPQAYFAASMVRSG